MNTVRLFVSHSWKYDDYDNLVRLVEGRGYFDFQESSVPAEDALTGSNKEVWEIIFNKIPALPETARTGTDLILDWPNKQVGLSLLEWPANAVPEHLDDLPIRGSG